MEFQAFSQGVRPGGVTTSHEIIILICYMTARAGQPVSLEQLSSALMRQELVNYFEFANAAEYMLQAGHLVETSDHRYTLSPLGQQTAETFESDLPATVRERALSALQNILTLLRRQEENRVDIEKTVDGWQLSITMTDIGTDLLSLKMFMPTKELCEDIRRRVLNDPTILYKGVFALLTGDMKTVGTLLPSGEDLFAD
ncbi:MAG: DUF4364 family protein [Angelakisella sp.]